MTITKTLRAARRRRRPAKRAKNAAPAGPEKLAAARSVRQLAHDLANALGGARLRVTLIRAEDAAPSADTQHLDALECLLSQACAIEEELHASIRRLLSAAKR
jgi:hypothetical protein